MDFLYCRTLIQRNQGERMFGKLKECRHIFSWYNNSSKHLWGFVKLDAIYLGSNS